MLQWVNCFLVGYVITLNFECLLLSNQTRLQIFAFNFEFRVLSEKIILRFSYPLSLSKKVSQTTRRTNLTVFKYQQRLSLYCQE